MQALQYQEKLIKLQHADGDRRLAQATEVKQLQSCVQKQAARLRVASRQISDLSSEITKATTVLGMLVASVTALSVLI